MLVTYALLVIILIFSIYALNDNKVMSKYLFHPYSIHHYKEHYRFLTHAFIHGNVFHLGFNCMALYSFGENLESAWMPLIYDSKVIGTLMYILLFTGGIYAASITEYIRNKNNSGYSSLGASGAVSAVIFARILVAPKDPITLFVFNMPGWAFGILMLGLSYYLIQRKRGGNYNDNISHESHFWGAIFGLVFIITTKPLIIKHFINELF
jgi:membrane associated rhomboid family serine protease